MRNGLRTVVLLVWVMLVGVGPVSAATGDGVRVEQAPIPSWVLPVPEGQARRRD